MSELSQLFTRTSRVLRDNVITELQKSNDFLRHYCLENNFCPLYRYKVKIKAHTWSMGAEQFQEANGVILSMQEFKSTVLYKDQRGSIDQIRVGTFNNRLLIITDERASELLS